MTLHVTALVAEDEPLPRDELAEELMKIWPELDIVGQAVDGIDALRQIVSRRPDVVFLDIRMPGMSGLEVARQAARHCHVVFVTAFDQHAIAAFEQGAVNYVMKPVSPARLATTVTRLKARVEQPPADLSGLLAQLQHQRPDGKVYLRWVNASVGTAIKLITVDEVCYFRADSKSDTEHLAFPPMVLLPLAHGIAGHDVARVPSCSDTLPRRCRVAWRCRSAPGAGVTPVAA